MAFKDEAEVAAAAAVEEEEDDCWLRPAAELVRRIGAHGDVKTDAVTVRGICCCWFWFDCVGCGLLGCACGDCGW